MPKTPYRLDVKADVNGRVHKADIEAFGDDGALAYTDRAT